MLPAAALRLPLPLDFELVDFRFDVKKLYALQAAIDQPGNAV
jgi:hypothetical protein